MHKVVIITAAGYKAASTQLPGVPENCPEPLLPLGNTTILARQVRQFQAMGFDCFVTVGRPGALYPWWMKRAPTVYRFNDRSPLPANVSPWTEERVNYVKSLGVEVIVIDEPDKKTAQDSICLSLDRIGYDWDLAVLSHGDHIYSDAVIEAIANHEAPCQIRQSKRYKRHNAIFVLTPEAARLYRKCAQWHRTRGMRSWFGNVHDEYGDYKRPGEKKSTGEIFAELVPLYYLDEDFPLWDHKEWCNDVDSPSSYRAALEWIKCQT